MMMPTLQLVAVEFQSLMMTFVPVPDEVYLVFGEGVPARGEDAPAPVETLRLLMVLTCPHPEGCLRTASRRR